MAKRDDWVSLVLTYDPHGWKTAWDMYRAGGLLWDKLRKRIGREFGKYDYVQTWEAHKSGLPHVNVAIGNRPFFYEAYRNNVEFVSGWLRPHVLASGFGKQLHVTVIYDLEGMAAYLSKISRELVGAQNKDQVPYNAPRHFRRLRTSVGLLPPPYKNPLITGRLVKRPMPEPREQD
jgi:hypothetical protein